MLIVHLKNSLTGCRLFGVKKYTKYHDMLTVLLLHSFIFTFIMVLLTWGDV